MLTIQFFNEQGKRSNNEDDIIRGNLLDNKGYFFAVCDGVGGANKGEVASELTCQNIKKYLQKNNSNTYNQEYMDGLIDFIENEFDKYINQYPEAKEMATTMALLIMDSDKVVVVHIGDSRIYHIRKNKILYKTQDHSLVNEFVKSGIITEEEARTHPQRNVITRAIQGGNIRPVKADVYHISDVQLLDYFFLCSDGVLESITDLQLIQILAKNLDDKKKMDLIREQCANFSKDNYSAFLIQIT